MKLSTTTQAILCIAMFCTVWAWHFLFAVMFLPTMVALVRGHHRSLIIALANVFLGWTPFWIILIVYASWREQPTARPRRYPRPNVQVTVKANVNHAVKNDDGTIRI